LVKILNCHILNLIHKIRYRVYENLSNYASIINLYDNDKKIGCVSLLTNCLYKIDDKDNNILIRNKECQYIMNRLRENIKQFIINY